MNKHIDVISVLWIVSGALGILFAFLIFWFFYGISFIPDVDWQASQILRVVGTWGSGIIAFFSIPEIIAGIGLIKRKEWGRILALVVSFFNLVWFPLGTALGVYSIIILLNDESVKIFNPQAK
ncbi:MAG: hypothetical protein OEZ45_04555 [Candidatus Aminicenantes bacterium]|nr:hypothetical protein [Candidatus Aminicenantes bacterium]MDH5705268.1 hypothetical protein [Candidatus Aminicenantes bacterium]